MGKFKAFLFDLNGTMIDDMMYHVKAWHRILNDLGATISLEETKEQCYGKNNELLERIFPGRFSEKEKNRMSVEKEKRYQEAFHSNLKLIKGLDAFLEQAYQHKIKMAIGSAAILFNVKFVLEGLDLNKYFNAIVSADDVLKSKPDPETYLQCAEKLKIDPNNCLVFEDSPKGTESAQRAGMNCVALTIMHGKDEFNDVNIIKFIESYSPDLFQYLTGKS